MNLRPDVGGLWENFLVSERMKQNKYQLTLAKPYFWRTTQQQEVDYVEAIGQKLYGYEFKWGNRRTRKLPKTFVEKYHVEGKTVTRENFRDFVIL